MEPVLSIIIPCYNHGDFLADALASVAMYSRKSIYEVIIINDGSTDRKTNEFINSLKTDGFQVIEQENKGLSSARNIGIKASNGKYILLLDADNKIRPDYIDKGIKILDTKPEIGIIYGDSLHFGELDKKNKVGKFKIKKLLIDNYIDACVVMRKEVWIQAKGYDTNLTALEDWDMHLSAYELGWQFHYVPEIMFEYRFRKVSMSQTINNKIELVNYIAKKHGNLYRNEFLKNITIKNRLVSALSDFFQKIVGNPQY